MSHGGLHWKKFVGPCREAFRHSLIVVFTTMFPALLIASVAIALSIFGHVPYANEVAVGILILGCGILVARLGKVGYREFSVLGQDAWIGGLAGLFAAPVAFLIAAIAYPNSSSDGLFRHFLKDPGGISLLVGGTALVLFAPAFIGSVIATLKVHFKR